MARWPAAAIFSFNCFAAAMLALFIAFFVGLPTPYWAMTTAYIVSNPLAGATRSKAVYRVAGTGLGGLGSLVLVPLLVNEPLALSAALALWVGGCLFISLLDRSPRAYVMMLAGYTAAIIVFPAVDTPERIFDLVSARVTEIVLGIVCATLTHSLIFPRPVGDVLRVRIARWLDDADRWLLDCLRGADAGVDSSLIETDRRHLAVGAVEMELLATHLPFDTSHLRETTGIVRALLMRILLLIPLLSGLADRRRALAELGDDPLDPAIAAVFADTAAWVEAGAPEGMVWPLRQRIDALAVARQRATWSDLLVVSLLDRLGHAVTTLAECRAQLHVMEHPGAPVPAHLHEMAATAPAPRFHRDIPFALLSAVSAAIAIMATCVLWIATGWTDGAGAAVLTAVFCTFFAAMDNPVPAILGMGISLIAGVPLSALYVFAIFPQINDFTMLCVVLAPSLLLLGLFIPHPRHGANAIGLLMGMSNGLALQERFTSDFARFLNSNLAQVVAIGVAVAVTATIRSIGVDAAIARLLRQMHDSIARLADTSVTPQAPTVLARTVDQLALLTPRLGRTARPGKDAAEEGLRDLRLAMNVVALREMDVSLDRGPRVAVARMLRGIATHFRRFRRVEAALPEPALLARVDRALAVLVASPAPARTPAIAAVVALRRNLFPDAPRFTPAASQAVPA